MVDVKDRLLSQIDHILGHHEFVEIHRAITRALDGQVWRECRIGDLRIGRLAGRLAPHTKVDWLGVEGVVMARGGLVHDRRSEIANELRQRNLCDIGKTKVTDRPVDQIIQLVFQFICSLVE